MREALAAKHIVRIRSAVESDLLMRALQNLSLRTPKPQAYAQVREALAAKHVIRVCSAAESDRVAAAARRLLDNAPAIRQSVDLSGAAGTRA